MKKFCSRCGLEKFYDEFAVSTANTVDGCQAWCKACKSRQPRTPLKEVEEGDEKLCTKCGEVKPIRLFDWKSTRDPELGKQAWCQNCIVRYSQARREEVRGRVAARRQLETEKLERYEIENAKRRQLNDPYTTP